MKHSVLVLCLFLAGCQDTYRVLAQPACLFLCFSWNTYTKDYVPPPEREYNEDEDFYYDEDPDNYGLAK